MTAVPDPFEEAARREEREELKREIRRRSALKSLQPERSGMSTALVVFGIPYVVWGLIRAASYHFGSPTVPRSIVHFFFGSWWWFGAYSALMLFLIWTWAITVTQHDDD
jgi:hypothetical protein